MLEQRIAVLGGGDGVEGLNYNKKKKNFFNWGGRKSALLLSDVFMFFF